MYSFMIIEFSAIFCDLYEKEHSCRQRGPIWPDHS